VSPNLLADAEFFIRWQSADARHTDHEYFAAVDLRRATFPAGLGDERIQVDLNRPLAAYPLTVGGNIHEILAP
jgi:hypothetical protein